MAQVVMTTIMPTVMTSSTNEYPDCRLRRGDGSGTRHWPGMATEGVARRGPDLPTRFRPPAGARQGAGTSRRGTDGKQTNSLATYRSDDRPTPLDPTADVKIGRDC